MAENFEELGLRSELVDVAGELGYMGPTPLQSAAIPVLRRGGSVVLRASAGAGTLAAYGLALLDRLAGGESSAGADPTDAGSADTGSADTGAAGVVPGDVDSAGRGSAGPATVRALILVPTASAATAAAESLARLGRAVGVRVTALGPGWAPGEGVAAGVDAEVVVASPSMAAAAVERSRLKLEGVIALVLDGASTIFALGDQDAVEMITSLVPREAQRVVVSGAVDARVADYVERHLRRALHIPPTPVEGSVTTPLAEPSRRLEYQVVAEWEKVDTTAAVLARSEPGRLPVVYCRSDRRVAEVADALRLRGFEPVDPEADNRGATGTIIVSSRTVATPADALVVSYDVPFDAESLVERHEKGGTVLVTPRELAHLKDISGRSGFEISSAGVTPIPEPDHIGEFRDRLRTALAEEDLGAQLLVLEPLFREFSAAEVAAAASALLRRQVPAAPVARAAAMQPGAAQTVPAPPPSYVRLFVGVGSRDGIVPSDLVGAITGEAQVKGEQVGRIEIRDTFSIVEVESGIAPRVIQAVNGITLKGRSVRVDFDRRGSVGAPRGGPSRGRPSRGGAPRGGPERPQRRIPRDQDL